MNEINSDAQLVEHNLQEEAKPIIPKSSNRDILTAAQGGGIIFFGRLFAYANRFIFGIIVARWIGASGFGVYNLGLSVTEMVANMALLGIQAGIMRYLPTKVREKDENGLLGILQTSIALVGSLSIGSGLVVFLLADWLANNIFGEPDLAVIFRLTSFAVPLIALAIVLSAVTRSYKKMHYEVYANRIAFHVSRLGLAILFLIIGFGVIGIILAHVMAWFVAVILLLYYLHQLLPPNRLRRSSDFSDSRELIKFSFPVYLTRLVSNFGSNFALFFLGAMVNATAVGIYSAALRIQIVGVMFLSAIEASAMPIISDLYDQGKNDELGRLYQTLTKWSLSFTLPFFLIVFLFAEPLLSIFGAEFAEGSTALALLALGTLANGGTGICGPMIVMTGNSRLSLFNSIMAVTVTIILDIILIPIWGLIGAAVAYGLSVIILNIVRTIQVYSLLKLWPYNLSFIKPIIAGGVAGGIILVINQITPPTDNLIFVALKIGVLGLTYIVAIYLLGLSEEDQLVVNRVRKRFISSFPKR